MKTHSILLALLSVLAVADKSDVHTRPHLRLRGMEDGYVDHHDDRADALDEVFTALKQCRKEGQPCTVSQGIDNCCPGLYCYLIVGEHKKHRCRRH